MYYILIILQSSNNLTSQQYEINRQRHGRKFYSTIVKKSKKKRKRRKCICFSAEFRFVMILIGNINSLYICVDSNSSKTLKTLHFTPQCFLVFCFSSFCRKVLFSQCRSAQYDTRNRLDIQNVAA